MRGRKDTYPWNTSPLRLSLSLSSIVPLTQNTFTRTEGKERLRSHVKNEKRKKQNGEKQKR